MEKLVDFLKFLIYSIVSLAWIRFKLKKRKRVLIFIKDFGGSTLKYDSKLMLVETYCVIADKNLITKKLVSALSLRLNYSQSSLTANKITAYEDSISTVFMVELPIQVKEAILNAVNNQLGGIIEADIVISKDKIPDYPREGRFISITFDTKEIINEKLIKNIDQMRES